MFCWVFFFFAVTMLWFAVSVFGALGVIMLFCNLSVQQNLDNIWPW